MTRTSVRLSVTNYCELRADVYRVLAVHVHRLHPSAEGILAEAQNVRREIARRKASLLQYFDDN